MSPSDVGAGSMITRLSREVVRAGCEGEDEAAGAEVFKTVCGAGCDTCSGTSCASAEPEIPSVKAVAARRKEVARMSAALRGNPRLALVFRILPRGPMVRAVNCAQNTLASLYIRHQEYILTRIYVMRHIQIRHDGNPASAGRAQPLPNRRAAARWPSTGRRHGSSPRAAPAASLETPARAQRRRTGGRARGRAAPDLCIAPRAAERARSLDRKVPARVGSQFPAPRWCAW